MAAISSAPELDHPEAGIPDGAYRLTRDALKERGRADGLRIAVLGDMLELGDTASALHLGLKSAIADAGVNKVFACGSHMKGLFDSLDADLRGAWAANSQELVEPLLAAVKPGDVIMVKGSLGSRMAVIVEALKSHGNTDLSPLPARSRGEG